MRRWGRSLPLSPFPGARPHLAEAGAGRGAGTPPLQLCSLSLLSVVGKLEKGPFPLPRLPLPADPLRAALGPHCPERAPGSLDAHTLPPLWAPRPPRPPNSPAQASFTPPACSSPSVLSQGHAQHAHSVRAGPLLSSSDISLGGYTCARAPHA